MRLAFQIISALAFFGLAMAGNIYFVQPQPVRAIIEVERLDLDQTAETPSSFVRKTSFSPDQERDDLLNEAWIEEVLASHPSSRNGRDKPADIDTLTRTVSDRMAVDAVAGEETLALSFSPGAFETRETAKWVLEAIATGHVDRRNQERERQKQATNRWAETKLAERQAAIETLYAIDEAKELAATPGNVAVSTDDQTLHRFFLNATKDAQTDQLGTLRTMLGADDAGRQASSIKRVEREYSDLSEDLERLETISFSALGSGTPVGEQSPLQAAEAKLFDFTFELDQLVSSGVLDKPAASLIEPPEVNGGVDARLPWGAAIPLAAAASIMLTLLATAIASFALSMITAGGRGDAEPDPRDDVLRDPYWPLKAHQRHHKLQHQPSAQTA